MQSKVDVINLALANLSNLNFIQDAGEDSPEAAQAAARWDSVFRSVLSEHPWGFASREAALIALAETPDDAWGCHYIYPNDCVKLLRLCRVGEPKSRFPFIVGRSRDNRFRVVKSGPPPIAAVYTTDAVPVPEMPADFVAALAWRLASDLALAKRADPELADSAYRAYSMHLERARLRDAGETGPRTPPASRWEAVRHV